MERARRPGGRSARVRAAVHQAVVDLLREEDWDELSLPRVAELSGVHQATLYRRWGTVNDLINDVVTEQLAQGSPVPDTGTLRGDLEAYAVNLADGWPARWAPSSCAPPWSAREAPTATLT